MNPFIKLVQETIQPHVIEEDEAFDRFKMSISWVDGHPTTNNIALWLNNTHDHSLYVLSTDPGRKGSIPFNESEIPSSYKYSWVIARNLSYESWEETFIKGHSYNVKSLNIQKGNILYKLDAMAVQQYIDRNNPFRDFNKINYTPKIFKKGNNGTYIKQ